MNEIVSTTGEVTELTKPSNFGQGMAFLNPADMPDLETAEVGMSIEPKYYEFLNVGDSVRAIFNGMGHITKKNQNADGFIDTPAIVFQTKEGVYLQAGANLVQQMQNIPPGTAVQITFSGKEKTNGGFNVNKFNVRLLNVPRVNVPVVQQRPTPKPVMDEYDPDAPIEIVGVLDDWSVSEAGKYWNISKTQAAQAISKKLNGRMDKREFLDWLHSTA